MAKAAPTTKPATAKPASAPAKPAAKPAGPAKNSPLRALARKHLEDAKKAPPQVHGDGTYIAQLLDIYDIPKKRCPGVVVVRSGKVSQTKAGKDMAQLSFVVAEPEAAKGQSVTKGYMLYDQDNGAGWQKSASETFAELCSDLKNSGIDLDAEDNPLNDEVFDTDFAGFVKRAIEAGVNGLRVSFSYKAEKNSLNFDVNGPADLQFEEAPAASGGTDLQTDEDDAEVPADEQAPADEEAQDDGAEVVEGEEEEGDGDEPTEVSLDVGSEVEFVLRDKTYEGVVKSFNDDNSKANILVKGEAKPRSIAVEKITMVDGVSIVAEE